MTGALTAYRWEIRKLVAQKRTYLGLAAAMGVPLLFVGVLVFSNGSPDEIPFGSAVRESGLAVPLVVLLFGSIWLFPLIVSLVAGDVVATEDGHGTLKTILTRSLDRASIFAAKAMASATYAVLALALMALSAGAAGVLAFGFEPLPTLSGAPVPAPWALVLTLLALGVYLMPLLAVAAIALLLSTATRNSTAAIVATLMGSLIMQLLGIFSSLEPIRPYLLTTHFSAWMGLIREPMDWAPVGQAAWVCALYAVPALGAGLVVFLRRDVAGG
jgi:ABC-2 type transport system permease protein